MIRLYIAVILLTANCTIASAANLPGSEWGLAKNGDTFLRFEAEGRIIGFSGCNSFFGTFETKTDHEIKFGPVGATRKLCPPNVMLIEKSIFDALETASGFRRDSIKLTLFDVNSAILLEMVQRDWD